jgi:hypothetical protein
LSYSRRTLIVGNPFILSVMRRPHRSKFVQFERPSAQTWTLLPKYHRKTDVQRDYKGDQRCDRSQGEYKKERTEDINYSLAKHESLSRWTWMI